MDFGHIYARIDASKVVLKSIIKPPFDKKSLVLTTSLVLNILNPDSGSLLRFLSQNRGLVENYLHYNDNFDIGTMEIGSMVEARQRSKVRGVSNNLEFENIGLENVSLYKKLTVSKFVRKQGFD